ncbi:MULTISPECIES: DUF3304 domain-containing protein [Enterobacter]|uniref:DUF3304 domain-containing protein n=1 Tax=Enterobacter TaxID=547 RepID=UPI001CC12778|nr:MULTISPECIES: DUF3304 domain-containing protein [Enterobacter]UAN18646.1 DUF3304 domain-containing protein [Enterobacter asburiae]UAN24849.1 DUF3304 domain-containing protein [Enterobacter sp. JBIWA003]
MSGLKYAFLLLILFVSGCSHASDEGYTSGDLRAVNHIDGIGINGFSVNGYHVPGLGGGYCCIQLPEKWKPGLKAHIEWEVDPNPNVILPPLGTDEFRKAYALHKAKYQQHSAIVDIPQYGKERCGLTVHFLPCNQVKVTTVCSGYGTANYPIKEPLKMKEPASCPV